MKEWISFPDCESYPVSLRADPLKSSDLPACLSPEFLHSEPPIPNSYI